jgi:hypothetical protein
MSEGLPLRGEASAKYERKDVNLVARYESDTAEECKPKIIRKRRWFFLPKSVIFHYRGNDDYYIVDIK